jgi:hypothetical protein
MPHYRWHISEGQQQAVTVLVVFILAGDQGHDLLESVDLEVVTGDVNGQTVDRPAHHLN